MFDDFWGIVPSSRIAFSGPDGLSVSYAQFCDDVAAFGARLDAGRGLVLLCCDGGYRQYVAYIAALSARCPVILSDAAARAGDQPFPVRYVYRAGDDDLVVDTGAEVELHPDLAVLLSTSGSTGAAKSVRLSHANIEANADAIVAYLGIDATECAALTLPFQYSYGMSVVNSHLRAGARIALVPQSVSGGAFWETFDALGCTSLAGVPHSFDLMEQGGVDTARLRHLRYMTQAGGKLARPKIEAWSARARAEGWRFVVMYGQTEAAPRMAYLPAEAADGNAHTIGRAIPGGTLEVRDEAGRPLPDGEEGELVYTGPNVMMGYARVPADLALGQGDDTLRTGDLARRLDTGFFEITGRQSRFVKLFGYRISLDEIDGRIGAQGIAATTAARGEELHVLAETDAGQAADLARDLDGWLNFPRGTVRVHPVEALPRGANGKIDGRAVRTRIDELAKAQPAAPKAQEGRSVAAIFADHFPGREIDARTTFMSLGGDSLNYLSVALDLEARIGDLPEGWEDMPARDLDALASGPPRERRPGVAIDTATLVRALAIVALAGGHLGAFSYGGGGAMSLFLIAGWALGAFTLPAVIRSGSVAPVAVLGIRVGVFTLLTIAANWILTGYGSWQAALFVSNWFDPHMAGGAWFVEVYLQSLLLLGALLLWPWLRGALEADRFTSLAIGAGLAIAMALVLDFLVDTHHLYRRLPFLLVWVLLCGTLAHAARTTTQRLAASAIAAAGIVGFFGAGMQIFLVVCLAAVIWIPQIRLPRIMGTPVQYVASASLAIYLTHFQFASFAGKIGISFAPVTLAIAVLGGVAVWQAYLYVDRLVASGLAARVGHFAVRQNWRRPQSAGR